MNNLEQVYINMLNMTNDQRVIGARHFIAELLTYFQNTNTNQELADLTILYTVYMFITADGDVTKDEYKLFEEIFELGFSYKQFKKEVTVVNNPQMVNNLFTMIRPMDYEIRVNLVMLALNFLSCDGELSKEEQSLVVKILSL